MSERHSRRAALSSEPVDDDRHPKSSALGRKSRKRAPFKSGPLAESAYSDRSTPSPSAAAAATAPSRQRPKPSRKRKTKASTKRSDHAYEDDHAPNEPKRATTTTSSDSSPPPSSTTLRSLVARRLETPSPPDVPAAGGAPSWDFDWFLGTTPTQPSAPASSFSRPVRLCRSLYRRQPPVASAIRPPPPPPPPTSSSTTTTTSAHASNDVTMASNRSDHAYVNLVGGEDTDDDDLATTMAEEERKKKESTHHHHHHHHHHRWLTPTVSRASLFGSLAAPSLDSHFSEGPPPPPPPPPCSWPPPPPPSSSLGLSSLSSHSFPPQPSTSLAPPPPPPPPPPRSPPHSFLPPPMPSYPHPFIRCLPPHSRRSRSPPPPSSLLASTLTNPPPPSSPPPPASQSIRTTTSDDVILLSDSEADDVVITAVRPGRPRNVAVDEFSFTAPRLASGRTVSPEHRTGFNSLFGFRRHPSSDLYDILHSMRRTAGLTAAGGIYENLLNLTERLGPAFNSGLSTKDINMIPTFKYSEKGGNDDKCVVCLCEFESGQTLRTLPCAHNFHKNCVDKWLKGNKTCPVCRENASCSLP